MKLFKLYFRYILIRIAFFLVIIAVGFGAYFFRVEKVNLISFTLTNPLYDYSEGLVDWLYIVNYFIFIFLIAIIIIFGFIVYYFFHKRKKARTVAAFENDLIPKLFDYLYSDKKISEEEKQIRIRKLKKQYGSAHYSRLIINALRRIYALTTHSVKDDAIKIYNALKYEKLVHSYLHSPYIRHKLFALKVIADFKLSGYEKYILKLVKSKTDVLHTESIITLIKLDVFSDLEFLTTLNPKLSSWDVDTIIKTINEENNTQINYKRLINSNSPEIATLGIMLARQHERTELKSEIIKKISHTNIIVKEEAFLAFISFITFQGDYEFLIDKFESAPEKTQLAIIHTIKRYQNKNKSIEFLAQIIENQPINQKIEAIKILLELDINQIQKFKKSKNNSIKQCCMQVLDLNL